jgi:hypothetical protein
VAGEGSQRRQVVALQLRRQAGRPAQLGRELHDRALVPGGARDLDQAGGVAHERVTVEASQRPFFQRLHAGMVAAAFD